MVVRQDLGITAPGSKITGENKREVHELNYPG